MTKGQRPRIVVVSQLCPFPSVHGNRARFIRLLQWLKEKQFAVTFVLQPLEVEDPRGLEQLAQLVDRLEVVQSEMPSASLTLSQAVRSFARALVPAQLQAHLRTIAQAVRSSSGRVQQVEGEERDIDRFCWTATCTAVHRAVDRERPIAVIAEYALLSKCLEGMSRDVLKIIDTVELFLRNADRFQVADLKAPIVCSPTSEKTALARADVLVAIQKNDARVLRELFPRARVILVPHSYQQIPRRPGGPDSRTILYVGSSNPYNVHGLRQFLDLAWPSIVARVPEATLRIVGSIPALEAIVTARIVQIGRVTDDQLLREYQTANVVINPQVAGTGLKIKCVEALSVGCPLVTNDAGADGLEEGAGTAFLLAKDWHEFANHVTTILTDDLVRAKLEIGARRLADEMFAPAAAFSELAHVLEMAVGESNP